MWFSFSKQICCWSQRSDKPNEDSDYSPLTQLISKQRMHVLLPLQHLSSLLRQRTRIHILWPTLALSSSPWPSPSFRHTMSWGDSCYVFEWGGSRPVLLHTAKESLSPSDPANCAALFLFDVAIVSVSWSGGGLSFGRGKHLSTAFHLCRCFGDVAAGCGL